MLPSAEDGEPHDCVTVIEISTKPRPDISDSPIDNVECIFYVDGSSLRREDGSLGTAYAVVSDNDVIETYSLPTNLSAQAAEQVALSRACVLADNKSLNVYTDSKFAHGIVHDFGAIWKERGFRTATGRPIQHLQFVALLLEAIQLPSAVAFIKCEAHTNNTDTVSVGNAFADLTARQSAKRGGNDVPDEFLKTYDPLNLTQKIEIEIKSPEQVLQEAQNDASPGEKRKWVNCVKNDKGLWVHEESEKPVLPTVGWG